MRQYFGFKNFSYALYGPVDSSLDFARNDNSKSLVLEVALALQRLGVFVLAQDIFLELHVRPEKVLEPGFDPLSIFQHFLCDVVRVDVDADRADDSKVLALDRNGCALEFSGADIELVVEFIFVQQLALFQIDQETGRPIA